MKVLMYHYVRGSDARLPYFRYLHVDDFRQQLVHLTARYRVLSRDEFLEAIRSGKTVKDGVVLTFDDGLSDHYNFVLPVLREFNIFGIFYVTVGPYLNQKMLDVHRIHMLLGRHGGEVMFDALCERVDIERLAFGAVDDFYSKTYTRQENDAGTTGFKRVLNYLISEKEKHKILDDLVSVYMDDEYALTREFYMTPDQIAELQHIGMIVGGHGVDHCVLSKLSLKKQKWQIDTSMRKLEIICGGLNVRSFCYPYGGKHTFSGETEEYVAQTGAEFGFSVDPRDVTDADLLNNRFSLPRYDCNMFPHGRATRGLARPTPDLQKT